MTLCHYVVISIIVDLLFVASAYFYMLA